MRVKPDTSPLLSVSVRTSPDVSPPRVQVRVGSNASPTVFPVPVVMNLALDLPPL